MRIIREGNISSYRNTCPYCGCEYEYEDKDVQFSYQYTSTGMKAYITCPCCKLSNEITQYNPKLNTPYPWYNPTIMYCNCKEENQKNYTEANWNHE